MRGSCATSGVSTESVACGRGWDLSDTGPTAEELVVDTLLPDEVGEAG